MKTLEELYNEILADEGLKEQLKAAAKENKVEEFFKAQGCEATIEEVKEFINSKKEVSLDELDSAAGGLDLDDFIESTRPNIACFIEGGTIPGIRAVEPVVLKNQMHLGHIADK